MKIKLFYQASVVALIAATLSPNPVNATTMQKTLASINIKTDDANTIQFFKTNPKSIKEYLSAKEAAPQLTPEDYVKDKQAGLNVDQIILKITENQNQQAGNNNDHKKSMTGDQPLPNRSTIELSQAQQLDKARLISIGVNVEGINDPKNLNKISSRKNFFDDYDKIKKEVKDFDGNYYFRLSLYDYSSNDIKKLFQNHVSSYDAILGKRQKESVDEIIQRYNNHHSSGDEQSNLSSDKTGSPSTSSPDDQEESSDHEQSSSSHTTSGSEKSESLSGHSSDSSSDEGKQKFNSGNNSGAHQSSGSSSPSVSTPPTASPSMPSPTATETEFDKINKAHPTLDSELIKTAYRVGTSQFSANNGTMDKSKELTSERFKAAYYLFTPNNKAPDLATTTVTHNLVTATEKLMTGHNARAQPTGAQIKDVLSALEKDSTNGHKIADAVAWAIKNGFGNKRSGEIPQAVARYVGIERKTGLHAFEILWNKGGAFNTAFPAERINEFVFTINNLPEEFQGIKDNNYIVFNDLDPADADHDSKIVTIRNGALVKED